MKFTNKKIKSILIYIAELVLCLSCIIRCIRYWASDITDYPKGVEPISFAGYLGLSILFTYIFVKDLKNEESL